MPIEKWSEQISIARLPGDQHLNEELQTLQERASDNPVDLVIDMSTVRYVNSSHIARLLKIRKLTVGGDRRMVLASVDPQVWGAFLVTGLDKVFDFAETVPTALATLQVSNKSS
jgi:anti-anti-sigma factor